MSRAVQDLRHTLRLLAKNPGFTLTAIVVMALGIGANTAIFSVVNAVLLRPLPYNDPGRLVMVWENIRNLGVGNIAMTQADYLDFRDMSKAFDGMGAFENASFNLSGNTQPERVTGARVSATLWPTLGVEPFRGRVFTEEEDHPGRNHVVVVSYGLWQRRFGSDPDFVGKTIHLDGEPYTVTGVMPRDFQFPIEGMRDMSGAELWVPEAFTDAEIADRGNSFDTNVIARLKPGVTLGQAIADVHVVARRVHEKYPAAVQKLFQLDASVTSWREEVVGRTRQALLVLLGAVAFVLLIGCANVANLLLARSAARQREIGIRVALGAGRGRLVRQLLTESTLLSLAGGALGLLLAMWGADAMISLSPGNIPRLDQTRLDWTVLGFALLASLVTGVVFGLAPAFQATHVDVSTVLKEGGRGSSGPRRNRLQGLLVVAEVALSLVLVVGAGLLIKSFIRLRDVNPGFRPDRLMTMSLALPDSKYATPTQVKSFYDNLLGRVSPLPGVESVGAGTSMPLGRGWTIMFTKESVTSTTWTKTLAANDVVAGDYFRATGIPLIRGRCFTPQDREGAALVVVISEATAKQYWPGEDPVGQRLKWGSPTGTAPWLTIVGIVGDVRERALDEQPRPQIYMPFAQIPPEVMTVAGRNMTLAVRTKGDPASIVSAVRGEVAALDSELPLFHVRTMERAIEASAAGRRFNTLLLGLFAALALVLAAVGLYGVMSYAVSRHTREIGVRLALGATARDVLRMVLVDGMRLVGAGLAIGLAASLVLARLLAGLLYGVGATDPAVYCTVPIFLAAVAATACYLPAWRASRVDPMVALRDE